MRLKGGARSKMEGAHNDKKSKITTITANCGLHPLIYTSPGFAQAQDVEKKKAEPKTPHLLSLNQDIVAGSQNEKCGLKYVIHIPRV